MKIEGSVVLVTGAGGGLGREFVRQFLERGAIKVYAAARKDLDWTDDRVQPLRLDVTDSGSISAAAEAAPDVTVLVNNAGVVGPRSLLTSPIADIRDTFETNVFGPLQLTRAFAPTLAAAGGGAIVDVHSVLSWLATPGAYSPSKAAFWGLTNALRLELADQGTQVLGAHLGYADTPMTAGLDVPKSDPVVIVARILDALAAGSDEADADELTQQVRSNLSALTTGAVRAD
ncbi:NAD(P)-dependent dehydrogenase (short-subunit alcohol dehydrogenase family) [Rhodococcus sp. LBL1]|uniref:NAD(P)-dependent dehydrogenase (Short-subunit alcohol dehydrogenase family) n=1 Tax=Prescottella agglutinans TaxID=1644129 RepID=A0ABT6M6L2_9NOCA|nr:SDR family oxidoreductase [Prescottella agglutinans]MDH6279942.1 NAD(P)-dependent dehydrogenase (short-subunit alcohol dehydrogenase family) [Prescottella agglutinans]MDH6679460.1 NAD(P)-dependent dehydrogenase (short-subunit alcohol dehydrogenase family) [Rhodococcus sp. LBL1]MDH6685401.1 NAD(P)-dependent dehydrogenase (short-subunit alcohol dehydrogenase family) [Rhodococcus sp. LBL2]